jgi:hypothetical protein
MRLITCRKCGQAKDWQLFAPGQVKRKSSLCCKCSSEENKRRYIRAVVPAPRMFRAFEVPFRKDEK